MELVPGLDNDASAAVNHKLITKPRNCKYHTIITTTAAFKFFLEFSNESAFVKSATFFIALADYCSGFQPIQYQSANKSQ